MSGPVPVKLVLGAGGKPVMPLLRRRAVYTVYDPRAHACASATDTHLWTGRVRAVPASVA